MTLPLVRLSLMAALSRVLMALALSLSGVGVAGSGTKSTDMPCSCDTTSEPLSSPEAGWDADYIPGTGWIPDMAVNQAGTFFRYGHRLLFLDGVHSGAWRGLNRSWRYGGLTPALVLGSAHLLIGATGSLGEVGTLLAKLHILNTWYWQARNIYNNGQHGGKSYLAGQFIGGIESHYRSRQGAPVVNLGGELTLGLALAGALMRSGKRWLGNRIVDAVTIRPPRCLEDQAFIDIQKQGHMAGSVTGGIAGSVSLRIHRVPRVLRRYPVEAVSEGCESWWQLLESMDRLRIDRLTIKPDANGSWLQVVFVDQQGSEQPGSIMLDAQFGDRHVPWLEHQLAAHYSRFDVSEFRSLLHPAVIDQVAAALGCMKALEGDAEQQCVGGSLYRDSDYDRERELVWSPVENTVAMTTWAQLRPGALVLYLGEQGSLPRMIWEDSGWRDGGGPVLSLSGGRKTTGVISQYWLTEKTGYVFLSQLDYLVRYLPHMMARQSFGRMIPAGHLSNAPDGLQSVDKRMDDYAPGWLSNSLSVAALMRRLLGR